MSQPSYEECKAEAYSMIRDEYIKEYGKYPSEEEMEDMYADYCERYRE